MKSGQELLDYDSKVNNSLKKIAVIGGGWYGSHIALELGRKGYSVTLYEKNSNLFSEISGLFGIRLHIGPHYPRSATTRKSCLFGFHQFTANYPELIVAHDSAVYAVGDKDASGNPSKVTAEEFIKVCQEYSKCEVIYNVKENGFDNMQVAVKLAEPSVYVGRGLHDFFEKKLGKSNVKIHYNYNVRSVNKIENSKIEIENDRNEKEQFDYVINATSFQALLPSNRLSLPFQVFYQPCLALVYEDIHPTSEKPFSFIVMDGWYPCIMPAVEYGREQDQGPKRYILTHGMWTIMASYNNVIDAKNHLESITDAFIDEKVRPSCESEVNRFLPSFKNRFKYVKWIGAVLAKIRNNREFRSSITFKDAESGMIYVLPGKVSNIFDAQTEVEAFLRNEDESLIHDENVGYSYLKQGTLNAALPEFMEEITERNTCDLQTFRIPTEEKAIIRSPISKNAAAASALINEVPVDAALHKVQEKVSGGDVAYVQTSRMPADKKKKIISPISNSMPVASSHLNEASLDTTNLQENVSGGDVSYVQTSRMSADKKKKIKSPILNSPPVAPSHLNDASLDTTLTKLQEKNTGGNICDPIALRAPDRRKKLKSPITKSGVKTISIVKEIVLDAALPEVDEKITQGDKLSLKIYTSEIEMIKSPIPKNGASLFSIKSILAMTVLLMLNELTEKPNQIVRYSLALAIAAASMMAMKNSTHFSMPVTFFNQASKQSRPNENNHHHSPKSAVFKAG